MSVQAGCSTLNAGADEPSSLGTLGVREIAGGSNDAGETVTA
jgi:hypothetical protein